MLYFTASISIFVWEVKGQLQLTLILRCSINGILIIFYQLPWVYGIKMAGYSRFFAIICKPFWLLLIVWILSPIIFSIYFYLFDNIALVKGMMNQIYNSKHLKVYVKRLFTKFIYFFLISLCLIYTNGSKWCWN